MKTKKFENKIEHLTQIQILSGAVSSLNQLLVDKGIISEKELQKYFKRWMRTNNLLRQDVIKTMGSKEILKVSNKSPRTK